MYHYCRTKIFVTILIITSTAHAGFAQSSAPDIMNKMEALEKGQQTIRKELQEIKSLLILKTPSPTSNSANPNVNVVGKEFNLENNPVRGTDNAKLTLVDFMDYQCPFCNKFARETLPQIFKQYVDSGKIRYVVLNAPLPFHKMAPKAAEASFCAKEQGKFWEIHDQMLSKQDSLNNLSFYALSIGLDITAFENCLKLNRYTEEISKSLSIAGSLGISVTPTFVIAKNDPGNPLKVKAIKYIRGAQPFDVFRNEIDQALASLPGETQMQQKQVPLKSMP